MESVLIEFSESLKKSWIEILPQIKESCKESFKNKKLELNKIHFIPKSAGLYFFEIFPKDQFSIDKFKNKWKPEQQDLKVPDFYKKNIPNQIHNTWNSFYLGKSENIQKRVKDHFSLKLKSSTYALKIQERKWLLKNANFRVSYFTLPNKIESKNVIQFIITNLEKELKTELLPWIGKQ